MGKLQKTIKSCFIIIVLFSFCSLIYGQKTDWYLNLKQIKILQSTKQDIERLFPAFEIKKTQKFKRNEEVYYESKGNELIVFYSTGKCPGETFEVGFNGYDAEMDTVIGLIYHPQEDVKISKLKLNLKGFESYKENDTDNFVYFNFDLGIRYGTIKNKVHTIEFLAPNSMKNKLCKEVNSSK